jgi:tetratricopeptide (TPR) repeat protein
MGDTDAAQAEFDAVLDVFRDDTGLGRAYALHGLGDVAWRRGEYGAAERHLEEAASLARQGDDAVLEGRVWLSAAALHRARGQADELAAALRRAVAVFAACGAAYLEIRALAALRGALAERGDVAAAEQARTRIESRYEAAGVPDGDRLGGC